MLYRLFIWIMRFVLLGMIFAFLYKIIKVMYSDIKGGGKTEGLSGGIEVVKTGDNYLLPVGTVYPLHPITNIGRLEDNSIPINSQFISGHHSRIYLKNNAYMLKDVGSTNGTYLNGTKINRPEIIKTNDLIGIGDIVFKVIG